MGQSGTQDAHAATKHRLIIRFLAALPESRARLGGIDLCSPVFILESAGARGAWRELARKFGQRAKGDFAHVRIGLTASFRVDRHGWRQRRTKQARAGNGDAQIVIQHRELRVRLQGRRTQIRGEICRRPNTNARRPRGEFETPTNAEKPSIDKSGLGAQAFERRPSRADPRVACTGLSDRDTQIDQRIARQRGRRWRCRVDQDQPEHVGAIEIALRAQNVGGAIPVARLQCGQLSHVAGIDGLAHVRELLHIHRDRMNRHNASWHKRQRQPHSGGGTVNAHGECGSAGAQVPRFAQSCHDGRDGGIEPNAIEALTLECTQRTLECALTSRSGRQSVDAQGIEDGGDSRADVEQHAHPA